MSQPLNTVLIGCGKMGRNHLRVLLENRNFALRAIIEPRKENLPSTLPDTVRVFESLEHFLETPGTEVDAWVVAAPTPAHHTLLKKLIPLKKAILVEKPLASTRVEARELVDLARTYGTSLSVGHLERFNPAIRKLKEVMDSGWLGNPIHFSFTRVGGYPTQVGAGNNVLLDLAVHDLDILTRLIGPSQVRDAICHSSWKSGILDTAEILLAGPNGASASLHVNWITPTKIRTLRVTGTRGVCLVDLILQTCEVLGGSLVGGVPMEQFDFDALVERYRTTDRIEFGIQKQEPLKVQLEHYFARIQGHPSETCTAEEAWVAVSLAEEAIRKGSLSVKSDRS